MSGKSSSNEVLAIFAKQGGIMRTKEALERGIHPRTLYALRDAGKLTRLSRGLYCLADLSPLSYPDLVAVAQSYPQAVICLISALAFHNLTTQIPHVVDIAIERGTSRPHSDTVPVRFFQFSKEAWSAGIEKNELDGVEVRIYRPSKSIADIFKYRNRLGLDVALEALKLYRTHTDFDIGELLHYARICRVDNVMRPYLEALL